MTKDMKKWGRRTCLFQKMSERENEREYMSERDRENREK